jgi:hypothetical protein
VLGVGWSCRDLAYWHRVRSGHSWQRGRLARQTSAPKSRTAQLTSRLRSPLTSRSASALSECPDRATLCPDNPRNRPRRRAIFTSRSGSARPYTMSSTAPAVYGPIPRRRSNSLRVRGTTSPLASIACASR